MQTNAFYSVFNNRWYRGANNMCGFDFMCL